MQKKVILIVEDDQDILHLLTLYLQNDFTVIEAVGGKQALLNVKQNVPDLILLDIVLPDLDGFEVCKRIREMNVASPIIFLSSKREHEDKINGLMIGADDYITKPFDPEEVVARVKANLRRMEMNHPQKPLKKSVFQFGDLKVNIETYTVTMKGEQVDLYAKEMQLLIYLMKHPKHVFSAEQLYNHVWGYDSFGDIKTVKVHISNLRRKIETDTKYIHTVRGLGYQFKYC